MKLKILALLAAVAVTINCFGGRYYECEDNDMWGLAIPQQQSQSADQLRQITMEDVTNIKEIAGSHSISYIATLPNGDLLSCNFFYEGPLQGEIDCSRHVWANPFMPMTISVRKSLFYEVERIYKAGRL